MFFCCKNKKILTSVIEPSLSPAFQPKSSNFSLTSRHPMAELIKAIEPLKKLKTPTPNPLLEETNPVNN